MGSAKSGNTTKQVRLAKKAGQDKQDRIASVALQVLLQAKQDSQTPKRRKPVDCLGSPNGASLTSAD